MIRLACDTSTEQASLSLDVDGHQSTESWTKNHSHSELILGAFQRLLDSRKITADQIDHYLCAVGPGSFTGLRVAVNFVKSLAYCYDKPVFTASSLLVLAERSQTESKDLVVLGNAFSQQLFWARYRLEAGRIETKTPPSSCFTEDLGERLKAEDHLISPSGAFYDGLQAELAEQGHALELLSDHRPVASEALLGLHSRDSKALDHRTWAQVEPLYIRASSAEEKLWNGGLKPPKRLFK